MKEPAIPPQKAPKRNLRYHGVTWIVFSPVIFLMAAISTVKSELTYNIQLVIFSAVALTGLIAGVGVLFKRTWAVITLLVLSWLGAAYFLGSATLLLIWPFIPGTRAEFDLLLLPIVLGIGVFGVPFLLMARNLRTITKQS